MKALERPNYGLDAPTVVRNLLVIGVALVTSNIVFRLVRTGSGTRAVMANGLWGGTAMIATALLMIWASRVGKIRLVERVVGGLGLRGDEQVLDVGCGHGLMLIAVARRLTAGRVTGVDIWSQRDQANNSAAATLRNAELEGVVERLEVRDGDARSLPFADASFDAVVSNLVIHNIPSRLERDQALREIARVLRPGGKVAIIDLLHARHYGGVLEALGFEDVHVSRPNLMFLVPLRVLTARHGAATGAAHT